MKDFKSIIKYVLIALVILYVLGMIIGGISFLTSPPSVAGINDKVKIDIGQDGYLIATIDEALEYKNENIPDGEVNNSNSIIKWKDARNISFVDKLGKKSYAIVWKESLKDSDLKVNNPSKKAYEYGEISNQKKSMFAVYCLKYNPKNKMVYGIILDNNANKINLEDLLYDILGISRSDVNYQEPSYYSSSSGRYHVDNSPSTIARNDPDWYYDHYDYGDNYAIDDYLESQGYD
jgi:hypothetical protein